MANATPFLISSNRLKNESLSTLDGRRGDVGARTRLSYSLVNRGSLVVKGTNLKEENMLWAGPIHNIPSYVWLKTYEVGNTEEKPDIADTESQLEEYLSPPYA